MRDIASNILLKPLFLPKAAVTDNTAQLSAVIDTKGFGSLALGWVTGVLSDADATFGVVVSHGDVVDDESPPTTITDTAPVADSDLVGTEALAGFTFADDGECRKIGYVGDKRFVQVTITPSGNAGNLFLAGIALLSNAHLRPVA
jgi:hypothetical protein